MQTWFVFALATGAHSAPATAQPREVEQMVAIQALTDELKGRGRTGVVWVYHKLTAETENSATFETWLANLLPAHVRTRVSTDLFRSYWTANRQSRTLTRPSQIGGFPVRLIKRLGEENLPVSGGVYSVSRVGLSGAGDSALVSVSFACRGLCGSQDLYLYVLLAGQWKQQQNLVSVVH